jgi:hypothetical protein
MQITHLLEILIPATLLFVLFYYCVKWDMEGINGKYLWKKLTGKK